MTLHRIDSFGVGFDLDLPDSEAWQQSLAWVLPPGWRARKDARAGIRIAARAHRDGWEVTTKATRSTTVTLDDAAQLVERTLRQHLALQAPGLVFIHAGVVEYGGRAVVIPGHTHTGKTTLVRALAQAGCGYLSDEYAVVDRDGFIHPYPRHLSVRRAGGGREHVDPTAAGFSVVNDPLRAGAIVTLPLRVEETPFLRRGKQGPSAMALMNNAVVARTRPRETLRAAAAVARESQYWRGQRRDATEATTTLLAQLRGNQNDTRW